MIYGYIVKKEIRRPSTTSTTIADEAVKAVASHVHHRVSGAHALGGERHDKEALRRWFERLGRVLPTLHITVNNIWVKGLAVAYHRVCAVGRHRNAAQRRRASTSTVVSTCSPCGG